MVTTGDYHAPMRSVGIKQLKARLSEYVRLAHGGEVVLVTDRDTVVAELGPARRQAAEEGSLEATMERLARRGDVTRAGEAKSGWRWSPPHLGLPAETAADLLNDLRRDR
jgi:antitoxin (DNA-binding transcriptional repressor) of toxin-antitoxin stability system